MRVTSEELANFRRDVPPPPPPIEPVLSAREEARLIASARRDNPEIDARRARVLALLRRPAAPEGADAELIALVAAARALPLERPDDRAKARMRLAEIGRLKDPPPEVVKLLRQLGLAPGDSQAFAEALLPHKHDVSEFSQNSYEGGTGPT